MAARNCPECGGLVASTINVCPHCGYQLESTFNTDTFTNNSPRGASRGENPYNSIALSIIALIFCWPFGLVSIIYCLKSDSSWCSGDDFYARHYGNTSLLWAKIPLWVLLGIICLGFLFVILSVVFA